MKYIKNIKFISLIIILSVNIFLSVEFIKDNNYFNNAQSDIEDQTVIKIDGNLSQVNGANSSPPNETISGVIDQRDGKIFSNISYNVSNCIINRNNPSLDKQPKIPIQGWNLTQAFMYFENITAINYTRDIETETNQYIEAHYDPFGPDKPTYIYQKFSIEISQYVNNVSIFMQDICDLEVYNDENSWEVEILNCSNDIYGTPNATLGKLQIPHPINYAAHWEVFNFLTSEDGSVFLNISRTKWTEDIFGNRKYWFCISVKIPPNDRDTGGGPKFLYMNPDGVDFTYIGEGDTFKKFDKVNTGIITYVNNVSGCLPVNGTLLGGSLNSFKEIDGDRYFAKANENNLTIGVNFTFSDLSLYPYTYDQFKNNASLWNWSSHFDILYHIDFHVVTNYSGNVDTAKIYLRDYSLPGEVYRDYTRFIDINQTEESELYWRFDPFGEKDKILDCMYTTNDVNNLTIVLRYNGTNPFNVTIDKFSVNFVEKIQEYDMVLPYDPMITELNYPNKDNIINGSEYYGQQNLEDLRLNDDNFYWAQADTNNLSIEFDFNILSQINSSYWEINLWDYLLFYPNPVIPIMYLRISQNVSIESPNNLSLAILEIYKGNRTLDILTDEENQLDWIQITEDNKTFANMTEAQLTLPLYLTDTWLALQFINSSANNTLRLRLRYVANESGSLTNFNVSIDECSLLIYVQNVISSDIACKLGLGLDSSDLKPTDIKMKNFGIEIRDNIDDTGIWENASFSTWENASFGIPSNGEYYFEVTSLWNSITFDVVGIYQIEKFYDIQWEYYVRYNIGNVLWNVSTNVNGYHSNAITGSRGLQVFIPSDWTFLNITPDASAGGGWYGIEQPFGILKSVSIYDISEGSWKVHMSSPEINMDTAYNVTNDIKIDKQIQISASIPGYMGGYLEFEVYNGQLISIWNDAVDLNIDSLENSYIFVWDIFDTTQSDGTYYLKSSWVKYNQTHAFLSLESKVISVLKYQTRLEFLNLESYVNNSIFGTEIIIVGNLTNTETDAPIERETIIIEIHSENGIVDMLTGITDDEGIIREEYTLPENYNWIGLKLVYNQTDSYYDITESRELIRINLISQGQYILNTFLTFLPYIVIVGAVTAVTLTIRHQRLSKLRKRWAKDALYLLDLLKISYIMIILKDSGVSVYNKMLAAEEIQPDLISGFLHAIAQFKREIKRDALEADVSKGFEMDYGDFKIVITDGKFARVAFVLEETPSAQLKERQTAFTWEFERKFEPHLIEFTGDLTPFNAADDLIEKYFNPSLTYPLKLGKFADVRIFGKLSALETALLEVAEQMQKEKKFFFVSSLLSYGLAGRKESRDQIISCILSLKEKGILEPYEFPQ